MACETLVGLKVGRDPLGCHSGDCRKPSQFINCRDRQLLARLQRV